jgi:hypothetical protein
MLLQAIKFLVQFYLEINQLVQFLQGINLVFQENNQVFQAITINQVLMVTIFPVDYHPVFSLF